ncbi:MAG: 1-deoxy-D-xylulose-5-phosphate synthase [Candidatus Dormibacteraeota bacterium]|nr:1-deoxy-D-xylulose-5-phosphate synthase [Candidatus Dormibacteraeota bacterium]
MLEAIHSPADLHHLSYAQLDELCQEIRDLLVEGVSRNGGHLSPNLGVVELTVALHRVFESPRDQIVWDTGHQAYVHKLLTGRADVFGTLRQAGGISGYPSRAESEHDLIENSHASTSLSYALGLAEAKLRRGEPGHVVAVIGDGAMTGGMAYEALNQIAYHEPRNLLIVLNDNGRSYAPTVGGMARHLGQLRLDPRYDRLKSELDLRLKDLPAFGDTAHEAARRMKESVKQLLQPTTVFDALGLTYAGPANGHDLLELERLLRRASQRRTPTLVHVITEKGRGYEPAKSDEIDKLHQVSPLSDPLTGRPRSTSLTYSDVAGAAVMDAAQRHPEVVAITAAMASSTGLLDFQREFPERFFDVGICEQHAVTFSAGLAMSGFRPIFCVYSTFLQRGFDQVLMDVGLHHLPVVFLLDRAGVTGSDGASAQGTFDLSYLRMVPGMRVAAAADATELCALLETALSLDGPVAIRFPKGVAPATPDLPVEPLTVGRWEAVRPGGDAAILAVGRMVEVAAVASDLLAKEGIGCAVVNARWIKPLDARLPEMAARYPVLVTAEDNVVTGGFGAAVLEALAPHGLAGRVRTAALPDEYIGHANPADILAERGLDPEGLAATVRASLRSLGDGAVETRAEPPRPGSGL